LVSGFEFSLMKVVISYQVSDFVRIVYSTCKLEITIATCPARVHELRYGACQTASKFHILISNRNQGPRQEREEWQRSRRSCSLYQTTTRSFKTVLIPCPSVTASILIVLNNIHTSLTFL
jgi:hypothetical protein